MKIDILNPLNPELLLWNIYTKPYIASEYLADFKSPSENILFPGVSKLFQWTSGRYFIQNVGTCNVVNAGKLTFHPLNKALSLRDLQEHMMLHRFLQTREDGFYKNDVYISMSQGVGNYLGLGDLYFIYETYNAKKNWI